MISYAETKGSRQWGVCEGNVIDTAVIEGIDVTQIECEEACLSLDSCKGYGYSITGCFPRTLGCKNPTDPPVYGALEYTMSVSKYT